MSQIQKLCRAAPSLPQGRLSSQAGLEAIEGMGTLAVEAEGVMQAPIDRFDDLAQARQPTPPGARPRVTAVALGGTDYLGTIGVPPMVVPRRAFKAFVGDVGTLGRHTDTG